MIYAILELQISYRALVYLYIKETFSDPEVLFKTCVAMKFVNDDDESEILSFLHFQRALRVHVPFHNTADSNCVSVYKRVSLDRQR